MYQKAGRGYHPQNLFIRVAHFRRNRLSGQLPINIHYLSLSIPLSFGTVLNIKQVGVLINIGVDFIVSPNFDSAVVSATKAADILSYPGVITPTECFAALDCGADGLKFFPASLLGQENLIALRAVLPADIPLYMVGGVGPENFDTWIKAGAHGFGVGSGIYKAGDSSELVAKKAESIVLSYDQAKNDK